MGDTQEQYWNNDKQQAVVEEDEINLLDYFRVLSKCRRMILLICGVAVITTAIISLLMPKIYSATASVMPPIEMLQTESELAGGLGMGESITLRKALGVTSIADMYAGILESRAVVDAIIDRFDLTQVYKNKKYKSSIRKELRKNTAIKVSGEGILTITVEDRDPNRAAAMANAYVEELDRQNKRLSGGQATSKRIFLENRLKEIELELSKIEDLLSRETKIKEMLFELLMRQCELAKIEEAKSMPTIQVLDRAVVPERKCKPRRRLMVMLSGAVSLLLAIFVAFGHEYFVRMKQREAEQQKRFLAESRQESAGDTTLAEVERKREIVGTRRRKRVQESRSYSREV